MTDKQQPEALRLANALEYCDASVARQAINELRRLHAELEALRAPHGQAPAQAVPAAVAGPSGYGPNVTVRRSCSDCKACNSESYAVQGDSGHYVYCEHPSLPESKYIGDTNWNTPHWCPVSAPTTQPAPQPSPAAQGDALDADPLQGAANWLAQAHGMFSPTVLQGCLMIGYNRAKRLHDAALAAQEGKSHGAA